MLMINKHINNLEKTCNHKKQVLQVVYTGFTGFTGFLQVYRSCGMPVQVFHTEYRTVIGASAESVWP